MSIRAIAARLRLSQATVPQGGEVGPAAELFAGERPAWRSTRSRIWCGSLGKHPLRADSPLQSPAQVDGTADLSGNRRQENRLHAACKDDEGIWPSRLDLDAFPWTAATKHSGIRVATSHDSSR